MERNHLKDKKGQNAHITENRRHKNKRKKHGMLQPKCIRKEKKKKQIDRE